MIIAKLGNQLFTVFKGAIKEHQTFKCPYCDGCGYAENDKCDMCDGFGLIDENPREVGYDD